MRVRAALLSLVLGVTSCRDAAGPEPSWLIVAYPSASELTVGTWMDIKIVARNTGTDVQTVERKCERHFRVRNDPMLVSLEMPGLICALVLVGPVDVAPGDSVVFNDSWDGKIADGDGVKAVAPGQYWIQGRIFTPKEVGGVLVALTVK